MSELLDVATSSATTTPIDDLPRRNRRFWRAIASSGTALAGLTLGLVIVVLAFVGPLFFDDQAQQQDLSNTYAGPGSDHWFGTDRLGRDLFARTIVAIRPSLAVGFGAALIALFVGCAIGLIAVSLQGRARTAALRAIDAAVAFPGLLTAILVTAVLGVGQTSVMLGVGIAASFSKARLVSTLALAEAGRDHLQAAQVLGLSRARIVLRHMVPNIAPPLIIGFSVTVGHAVVVVAALGFLGLGIQPPSFDLGSMLTDGMQSLFLNPMGALAPAAVVAVISLSAGLVGDAVARALNPRLMTSPRKRTQKSPVEVEPGGGVRVDADGRASDLLGLRGLKVTFERDGKPIEVVKDVTFNMNRGDFIGIVGESGSGKTMTALSIAGLVPTGGVRSGDLEFLGRRLDTMSDAELDEALAHQLAFVFQDPMTSLNPALAIGTQMTMGVRRHLKIGRKAALERAANRLEEVRLPGAQQQLRRFPHELSGGMRQRVMIALGLMMEPSLIIADEPTTALDVTVQAQIMTLLRELNARHGTGVILISHDLHLVGESCDRILVMYAGRIVEDADSSALMEGPLHPYSRALLQSVPVLGEDRAARLSEIPGEAPESGREPAGCPFHTRCPIAVERCSTELPALVRRTDGRRVACHLAGTDNDPKGTSC